MKQGWEIKKLGEVCSLIADGDWIESRHQSDDGIRLIQTGNIGNGVFKAKDDKPHYISESTFAELGCTEIFAGDCLVSRLPDPVGRACIIPETNCRMITAVDCSIIRFNSDIVSKFFIYYTQCEKYKRDINNNTTGTTRKRISRKNLETITTPVPPREEQERIVAELDCLSGIIERKREQLKELDALAESIFYTMFGDPITNEKRWEVKKLGEIATSQIGITYKPENVSDNDEGTIVLRSSNIQDNTLCFEDIVRVKCAIKENKYVKDGDILMCSRNGSFRLVGKVAMIANLPESMTYGAFMTIIRSPYQAYLFAFFKTSAFRSQLTTSQTATINQITVKMLDEIKIALPPMELQQEFADKIEAIEKQKELIKQSIAETETLFNSRMDYYFN